MAKRFFALNAPPTECLCCNHVCRQRSNSGEQACSGMPYPRISPHFPPVFPRFSPFFPVFPRFSPFFPISPHFPHFSHFSVAQKRLGDSGVGDFQGLPPSLGASGPLLLGGETRTEARRRSPVHVSIHVLMGASLHTATCKILLIGSGSWQNKKLIAALIQCLGRLVCISATIQPARLHSLLQHRTDLRGHQTPSPRAKLHNPHYECTPARHCVTG